MNSTSVAPRLSVRNAILGIGNGIIFQLTVAALDPETVLTAFALKLLDGNIIAVGILCSAIGSGWYLPEAFLAPVLARRQRMLPFYRVSAVARVATVLALWAVVQFWQPEPKILFFAFVAILLLAYTSISGVGIIPFYSIVMDTIPPNWRGKFFGTRWFVGGLLGFGAGLWVKHILSEDSGLTFPENFAKIFLFAAVSLVVAVALFAFTEERPRQAQTRRLPFRMEMARGPRFFRRDRTFRRATRARALFMILIGLTFPFVVPYALVSSNMTASMVGIFLAIRTLASSFSNLFWSQLSDRRGNHSVMVLSGWMLMAVVASVLLAPLVPADPLSGWLSFAIDTRVGYFLLIAVLIGATRSGAFMGHNNYLLEISPDRVRTTYLGFYYTTMFPLAWVPFLGSLMIGAGERYMLAFAVSGVLAILLMVNLAGLAEVRGAERGPEGSD